MKFYCHLNAPHSIPCHKQCILCERYEKSLNDLQAEGAAVGQRSVGTNAEAKDCETCKHFWNYESYPCSKCDEDYSMWEAPPEGALPR
jgi:hypothetical protein